MMTVCETHANLDWAPWVSEQLNSTQWTWSALAGDASARRYYRCYLDNHHYILAVADPAQLSLKSTLDVNVELASHGIPVPHIYAYDLDCGLILQEDLGDQTLWHQRHQSEQLPSQLSAALQILNQWQSLPITHWPKMDSAHLKEECRYLPQWFIPHRGIDWDLETQHQYEILCDHLIESIQPTQWVPIHRDFHSRNLMIHEENLYVIDTQDAMMGHPLYDLASLLGDGYLSLKDSEQHAYLQIFYKQQHHAFNDFNHFQSLYERISIQRYLKILGIFARLAERDHKPLYLKYIPNILNRIQTFIAHHEDLMALSNLPGLFSCKR